MREDRRKPRILVQTDDLEADGLAELFTVAEEYGWQLYDLKVSRYVIPTNPTPDGALVTYPGGFPRGDDHSQRTFTFPSVYLQTGDGKWPECDAQVSFDRYGWGQRAMDYFNDAGFTNGVIFLANEIAEASPVYQGAIARAEELGLNLHIHVLSEQVEHRKDRQRRFEQTQAEKIDVLSALPKPLAYFGATDILAARFCFDCQSSNLSVPEDIAVLGSQNRELVCNSAPVPLSSIDPNRPLAVRTAAEILKKLMEGGEPPETKVIIAPKEVVVRRSTDMLAVTDPRVAHAVRYMWDHLDQPFTVEDIAKEVGVTRQTLGILFKKCLGRGVNQELRRRRLEKTRELLKYSDMRIEEIGTRVGFSSPCYIYRLFEQAYGITPSAFRKQYKTTPSDTPGG